MLSFPASDAGPAQTLQPGVVIHMLHQFEMCINMRMCSRLVKYIRGDHQYRLLVYACNLTSLKRVVKTKTANAMLIIRG